MSRTVLARTTKSTVRYVSSAFSRTVLARNTRRTVSSTSRTVLARTARRTLFVSGSIAVPARTAHGAIIRGLAAGLGIRSARSTRRTRHSVCLIAVLASITVPTNFVACPVTVLTRIALHTSTFDSAAEVWIGSARSARCTMVVAVPDAVPASNALRTVIIARSTAVPPRITRRTTDTVAAAAAEPARNTRSASSVAHPSVGHSNSTRLTQRVAGPEAVLSLNALHTTIAAGRADVPARITVRTHSVAQPAAVLARNTIHASGVGCATRVVIRSALETVITFTLRFHLLVPSSLAQCACLTITVLACWAVAVHQQNARAKKSAR